MKKYWVNNNIDSIKTSFKCFQKKFSASSLDIRDDMVSFENGVFKYICVSGITSSSSYNDDDDYRSVENFNVEHLNAGLSFLISNIIPRLPSKHIKEFTQFARKHLVTGTCYKNFDWYTNYTCDTYQIEFEKLIELSKIFLKENNLFREKHEFIKTN